MGVNKIESNSKWDLVGHYFTVNGSTTKLTGWHTPDFLRKGDLIHVDELELSTVVSVRPHRGGSRMIELADGREICVAGESDLAVFEKTSFCDE